MKKRTETVTLRLEYSGGKDERDGGIYGNHPLDPKFSNELVVAVRSDTDPLAHWSGAKGDRPQVHLAGSARALEELGRYLIALARLDTKDPEPHAHFHDVRNPDGGTVHLMPRRLSKMPKRKAR
jgi:hypothetical protein